MLVSSFLLLSIKGRDASCRILRDKSLGQAWRGEAPALCCLGNLQDAVAEPKNLGVRAQLVAVSLEVQKRV